jgi:hypothetical protein
MLDDRRSTVDTRHKGMSASGVRGESPLTPAADSCGTCPFFAIASHILEFPGQGRMLREKVARSVIVWE